MLLFVLGVREVTAEHLCTHRLEVDFVGIEYMSIGWEASSASDKYLNISPC